jgi:hypothetical protein
MKAIRFWGTLFLALVLTACSTPASGASPVSQVELVQPAQDAVISEELSQTSLEAEASADSYSEPETVTLPAAAEAPKPTAVPTQAAVENQAKANQAAPSALELNPLTGQPCDDPSLLNLPPALVSVSNFPVTSRPQAGLSFAPYVFEMYIGEGMTRFLALFYCTFPSENVSGDNTIGPIRSGRLPYESLRKLYNGFLVMASASGEVSAQLGGSTNVFGSDAGNINSALIDVGKLKGLAQKRAGSAVPNLSGNLFEAVSPQGGASADKLWVFYNFLNQVMWTYDLAGGVYLRAQDTADGTGKFIQSTDRLTGEPLAFENVIVLMAEHEVLNSEGTLIDVNLLYSGNKAFLFRDGQMYPIRWTTVGGEYEKTTGKLRPIRFVDAAGNPVALKPGRVWVEFVHLTTTLSEVEAGLWKARFYAP